MNFCIEFLQELLMLWEAISNTRKSVSSDIQHFEVGLKNLGLRLVFQPTSQCLDIWWNTLHCVWYITYMATILYTIWVAAERAGVSCNDQALRNVFSARRLFWVVRMWRLRALGQKKILTKSNHLFNNYKNHFWFR